ncbi:PREDICTED: sialidase-4-like [Nanorana parkeri]|uniref:sialidase-4-like n=1 Tax=Nanorana parkeri TaxID=125878 RepID=UPI000854E97E|nr:PREDICTED: sialidase-4-like [Nanorana parkeri]
MKVTQPEKTLLFKKESNGSVFRIPSLIYIKEANMFLAFAEKRKSENDAAAEYLVMRRGIYKTGYVTWEGTQSLQDLCLKDERMMNPCPVYDKAGQVLFLFFNSIPIGATEKQLRKWGNSCKLCYATSKDCGKTWSSVTNITYILNVIDNMATFFLSPGHGIQTDSGTLVVPAYVYVAKCWCIQYCCTKSHSFYLYSKDGGGRWKVSERIEKFECGECEMAEIVCEGEQKMLYCNARTPSKYRVEALTLNAGGEFKMADKSRKLKDTTDGGCFGSIVSFPGIIQQGEEGGHWLLYSHPAKKDRKELGIFLNKSPMSSEAWSKPWVIHHGPAAYSDLAKCHKANTFAILYESGKENPYEEINFCLFTLEDVLENINKKKGFFYRFKK